VLNTYDKHSYFINFIDRFNTGNGSLFNFQIGSLSEASIYKVRIYAINSKGKSDQIWISAQTLRKAEKFIDNNTTESSLLFSAYSLNHLKVIMLSLVAFLLVILVVIVSAITYMSRFCQRIKNKNMPKNSEDGQEVMSEEEPSGGVQYLENLGIHTVYTETNDAICSEYYSNLLAQYSPKNNNKDMQLLSLDLYKINNGPPDLIPTFYFNGQDTGDNLVRPNS